MSLKPFTASLFGFVGGFTIAESLFPPALFDAISGNKTATNNKAANPDLTAYQRIPMMKRTMEQDIAVAVSANKVYTSAAAVALILFGGTPAIFGAAANAAFRGPEGAGRYTALKTRLYAALG